LPGTTRKDQIGPCAIEGDIWWRTVKIDRAFGGKC
jgi:hypothetical protein